MPMIDVYAAEGTFSKKHALAKDLAAAVMRWEKVPDLARAPISARRPQGGAAMATNVRTLTLAFWIVDAFASEEDRQTHIKGPIAAALMANADRLLASPPEILPADILASKVPGQR